NDLKWKRHVGRSRHPRQVTLHLGIELEPVRAILVALGECFRTVWKRSHFDDTETAGNGACRAELQHRAGCCRVRLDVVVRGIDRLPDAIEVRLAVRCTRRAITRRLRADQRHSHSDAGAHYYNRYATDEGVPHLLRVLFCCRFAGLLLVEPGTHERVVQAVIAFVTCMLEQRPHRLSHHSLGGPWTHPHALVLDGEVVLDCVVGRTP